MTATDITPRHVEYINNHLKDKTYQMETAVLDATDMSMFKDESFDVVLNMGPFYHLTSEDMRRKCFWTDTYYSSYEEMQQLYQDNGLSIEKHFAQDGMAPMFHNTVDEWSDEQFKIWYKYHLSVCEEKSIIDMSNHVVIVGRKN